MCATRNSRRASMQVVFLLLAFTYIVTGNAEREDSQAKQSMYSVGGANLEASGSYSRSHSASFQASGSHSAESSFHSSSSSYQSSHKKSSSSYGGSSQQQAGAKVSGSEVSGSGSHLSSSAESSSKASQNVDRQNANAERRGQDRPDVAPGQPQRDAQASANMRSSSSASHGHQSSNVSSSRSASVRRSSDQDDARSRQSSSGSRDVSSLDRASALSSDSEERNYYRRLFSRRCKDCTVKGQTYRGHSRFEYSEDCSRFRCICRCNGTYTCPPRYTMNICRDGQQSAGSRSPADSRQNSDLRRRRCKKCEVLGQQFEGNAYFDVQDGCTKFRGCICYCNGTWVCPSDRAINTCQQTTPAPSACRACNAQGKIVAANSVFELEEPCRRYRHCRCHCNGSWECPSRFAENTCQSPTARPQAVPGCRTCPIPGDREVAGNTYFQMKNGCMEYKNCVCRCNGSWACPSKYARDVCKESSSSAERRTTPHHLPVSYAECQSCLAYGRYFRGNTYFNTRQGCRSFERCVCRCDGSWDCPARYVRDLCRDDDPTNDVDNPNATCSFCEAEGEIIPSNSFFNLTKDCIQHTQCLCHCDGAWSCAKRYSRNICQGPSQLPPQPEPERDCSSCLVGSRVVRGNSYFDFTSACFRYRDCLCKCDGTYSCEEDRAVNICNYSTTAAASSSASASSPSVSMVVVTPPSSCMRCLAFGQLQEADTDFVHEEDCVEYECHCHCNGTYTCPMERARRTCQPGCRECEVGGQFFEGNTYFQHSEGCLVYLCTCFCNGTYYCPADRANNTCQGQPDSPQRPSSSGLGDRDGQEGRGQCTQCVTNDGATHAPNTDFKLTEGCIDYQCRCHCDGSWNCPGETARNTCRGEVLGGCRSCVLSDSQIYRGGEEFQMRDGCIHYKCQCRCDGSWHCPGEQARDICLGEVPGGCRVCRVSRNETYRGGSAFQLRQGCYHYQCQCHCNGSWECPGETARDVCIGEVPGGCRVCKLDSGEIYLGESDFQMVKNCIHYNCRCNCDGGWNCPGEKARRVCNADGSPINVQAETTTEAPPARCRRCEVSDRESFTPNQPFTLRRGCNVYQCECQCDGSWNCPPSQTRNLCRRRDDPELRAQTCASCQVSSYTYPGRSSFLLTRGCAQYTCQCDCRGQWTCDHRVARDICQDNRQGRVDRGRSSSSSRQYSVLSSVSSDRSPQHSYRSLVSDVKARASSTARGSSVSAANLGSYQARGQVLAPCRPCRVEGRNYNPNTNFSLEKKCKMFHCYCSCNGRWRCPRNQTEDLCAEDGYNERGRRRQPQVPPGAAEAQRYGRANVRIVSADAASSSSSSSSSSQDRRDGSQDYRGLNVRGYYVNSAAQSSGAGGQYVYSQADRRPFGPQFYSQGNGQAGLQFYSQGNGQAGYQFYSQGKEHRQAIQQSSLKQDGSSAGGGAMSVVEGGAEGSEPAQGCSPCQVDAKQYRTGAQFDWRRGCVIYKCTCLCSGSYRCRLSLDPDCQEQEAPPGAGGIPTGPAVGGKPANQPGGSCGNCYVQGLVYPGNMSFTLRQGCQELSCHCHCEGNHECGEQKPIAGCVAVSTPLEGAGHPYSASSAIYPLGGGAYAVRPGRVVNTFQQTVYSGCPSCGQGQQGPALVPSLLIPQLPAGQNPNVQQPSGQDQSVPQSPGPYRYPLAAQPQQGLHESAQVGYFQSHSRHPGGSDHPVNPQNPANPHSANPQPQAVPAHFRGRTSVQRVPMQPVHASDSAVGDNSNKPDYMCATCFVNGQLQRGSFQFVKDCSHVRCHCDCSGRLYCSVHQARVENCPVQRPASGGCGSCLVQNQNHAPHLPFPLRIGCYGYDCTCQCGGVWECPRQQPTNYCVQPPGPLPGVVDTPQEGGQGAHHSHPGGKAGLEDARSYGRSAQLPDRGRLLDCHDCEVRGTTYPSRSRFLLRDDCLQHTCDCACDGSWACAKNLTVDICRQRRENQQQQERRRENDMNVNPPGGCHSCRWGNKSYPGGSDFSHTDGCWQFDCHCGCNGAVVCPPNNSKDLCRAGDSMALRQRLREEEEQLPLSVDCKPCLVDGQLIRSRTAFSRTQKCWEFLCQCECNGTWTCPPDRSINTCQMDNAEDPASPDHSDQPKGCRVGRKTYFTRLFAFKDGCVQHMCICYNSGAWRCPEGKERRLC